MRDNSSDREGISVAGTTDIQWPMLIGLAHPSTAYRFRRRWVIFFVIPAGVRCCIKFPAGL